MLIIILLIWVVGSYGSANNTTTTASLAGCIDKSPYCNKNDCTIRPGYAIQFCHKTCSNCQPFCVESTIVACDQSVKDQCKDMLKEYCPVLCGICKIANKVANITEGGIPAVTVFNVNKSAIYDFDSQKMLKDDSGYTQKSIKLDNQWYINPNYKKPLPGLNNYPINNVPQNENHLEEEASSPDQLPFDSMTHLRRKNKKESDHKRRGYGGESGGNNQIQENGEIYEEEDDYEDYLKNSVPLAFHNKKRNKLKGRGDETNFNLRKPFHPPGFNQGLVVPTAAISDNQLIDEEQKNGKDLSLQEIDERVGNLPPFAFADLLTLLGCRDRDQHICSKITEEACKGRPGFYLKICPVKCKNCNGQTCIDSNKVDCAEVKSLGGCRLAIAEDYCPRTCSLCPSSSIIPQTQSICRDELDTCEQLAESGVCKNSASMPAMRVYCAKSCNWCKKTQIYVGTNEEGSLTSEINALLMLKKNDNVKRPFKLSKFRS